PSLGFNFLIAANGEIMIVAWSPEPTGWCHCDGRLLSATTHSYLFSHLGTTYGGNSSNFAIPDLRGRVVLGDDNGGSWPRGAQYGANFTILTLPDIAAHTHTIPSGNTDLTGGSGNSANNYQPSLVLRWLIAFSGFYPS